MALPPFSHHPHPHPHQLILLLLYYVQVPVLILCDYCGTHVEPICAGCDKVQGRTVHGRTGTDRTRTDRTRSVDGLSDSSLLKLRVSFFFHSGYGSDQEVREPEQTGWFSSFNLYPSPPHPITYLPPSLPPSIPPPPPSPCLLLICPLGARAC